MPVWLTWTLVALGALSLLCWAAFGVVLLVQTIRTPTPPAPEPAPPHVDCDGCQECLRPSHRPPETTADLPADMQLPPARLMAIEHTAHLPATVRWLILGDQWTSGDAVLGAVLEGLRRDEEALRGDQDRIAGDWQRAINAKHSCPRCGQERCNHKGRHRR